MGDAPAAGGTETMYPEYRKRIGRLTSNPGSATNRSQ